LWKTDRQKLFIQNSVRLAGQSLFIELLQKNLSVFEPFLVSLPQSKWLSDQVQLVKDTPDSAMRVGMLEFIINKCGDDLLRVLPLVSEKPDVQRLCDGVCFGLSGIFYYTGLLIRHQKDSDQSFDTTYPHLYIGGNGSRLFRWVARGASWSDAVPDCRVFSTILEKSSGLTTRPGTLHLSKRAKHEAAYGLVVRESAISPDISPAVSMIAGEEGNGYHVFAELTDELFHEASERLMPDPHLPELNQFVTCFNDSIRDISGHGAMRWDANLAKDVSEGIYQKLTNMCENRLKRPKEPPFILGLKEILSRWWENQV
jgi:hypothetical protein